MILLYLIISYLAIGLLFSIPFLIRWIHVLDESAHDSPWDFKLAILPGCIVFWPVLLRNYLHAVKSGKHG